MKDAIGDRMKNYYENITRMFLPKKTYTIIRLDGKAFHTLTKRLKLKKPFDESFTNMMDETAKYLCENIQGCILGYVQSDEISLVLQDFKTISTDAWFDGNIQKITSISASMATAKFNQLLTNYRNEIYDNIKLLHEKEWVTNEKISELKTDYYASISKIEFAFFDSRCFTISQYFEVYNYLVWRIKDCMRNSILNISQCVLGKKKIDNKNCKELKEELDNASVSWDDYDDKFKYGRFIFKESKKFNNEKGEYIRTIWNITPASDLVNNIEQQKRIYSIIKLEVSNEKQ